MLFGLLSSPTRAELNPPVDASELALLPEYCPHTITFQPRHGSMETQMAWLRRLGEVFRSMHHYCWALTALNRASRANTPVQMRPHLYRTAIADIEYVLKHSEETFVLLPEILTRRGEAQARLREFGPAEVSFREAVRLKADYWPAYKGLAQLHIDQGKRSLARETLQTGLSNVSEKRVLSRMLEDLKEPAK